MTQLSNHLLPKTAHALTLLTHPTDRLSRLTYHIPLGKSPLSLTTPSFPFHHPMLTYTHTHTHIFFFTGGKKKNKNNKIKQPHKKDISITQQASTLQSWLPLTTLPLPPPLPLPPSPPSPTYNKNSCSTSLPFSSARPCCACLWQARAFMLSCIKIMTMPPILSSMIYWCWKSTTNPVHGSCCGGSRRNSSSSSKGVEAEAAPPPLPLLPSLVCMGVLIVSPTLQVD